MPAIEGSGLDIREVCDPAAVTAEFAEALTGLLMQLAPAASALSQDDVRCIVGSPATRLVVATNPKSKRPIGMLTLVVVQLPTGVISRIEDVVVDEAERGRGIGEKLVHIALILARESEARFVELTSRPTREGANRLYERLGFARRETNVYRLALD